jgi:hypothetical protein
VDPKRWIENSLIFVPQMKNNSLLPCFLVFYEEMFVPSMFSYSRIYTHLLFPTLSPFLDFTVVTLILNHWGVCSISAKEEMDYNVEDSLAISKRSCLNEHIVSYYFSGKITHYNHYLQYTV